MRKRLMREEEEVQRSISLMTESRRDLYVRLERSRQEISIQDLARH